MNDQEVEQELKTKGKTAPRVTPDAVEASVLEEHYFTGADGVLGASEDGKHLDCHVSMGLLTLCVLVLENGFVVVGQSACASPSNFDADIGRALARADAKRKVWPLLGYELRTKLGKGGPA